MKLGIDNLLSNTSLLNSLRDQRLALLGHPASITHTGQHSLDALMSCGLSVVSAFGPQHGMRGDKQDNMVESEDYVDPVYGIPVFSLYGQVRWPTQEMMDTFDVLLVDLQDIGTRIYTFITTLAYMLEACAENGKRLLVLDRPNPAGRALEGTLLEPGWESFVGAAPMLMRHGLTLGEFARWYIDLKNLDVELQIVRMTNYDPLAAPGYGWPLHELPWINPSPNASSLNMARCFPGTVLFEGTTLSERRGTTTALEVIGAPDIDFDRILNRMAALAPSWQQGVLVRPCFFEPTFHKHTGRLCHGLQIHTDFSGYHPETFKPYRLAALLLKSIRLEYPDYPIWNKFPYEYETERLAFDLLCGGPFLRKWIVNTQSAVADLQTRLVSHEAEWASRINPFLLY